MHIGLHHHRVQRHVDPPAWSQQRREERPGAGLGNLHRQIPRRRGHHLLPRAVTLGDADIGVLVRAGTDPGGRLRIHQRLQHRERKPADQLTPIGAAQHLGQLEQGRLVQGHRVSPFSE